MKCHTKKGEGRDWAFFMIFMPPTIPLSTASFEVKAYATQKHNHQHDTFVEKTDFFIENLSARGYNEAELSKASSSINLEDLQLFIQEKPKSTAIPLFCKTKYNLTFLESISNRILLKNEISSATM